MVEVWQTCMLSSFDKICRICLAESPELLSIYSKYCITLINTEIRTSEDSPTIRDMLSSIVTLNDNLELPSNVCISCVQELMRAFCFKEKCERNEGTLVACLNVPEVKKDQSVQTENASSPQPLNELTNYLKIDSSTYDGSQSYENTVTVELQETVVSDPDFTEVEVIPGGQEEPQKQDDSREDEISEHDAEEFPQEVEEYLLKDDFPHEEPIPHQEKEVLEEKEIILPIKGPYTTVVENFIETAVDTDAPAVPKKAAICTKCGSFFAMRRSLLRHQVSNKCQQRNYQCSICKRVFVRKRNLIQHMGSHSTKDKPFKCTDCPKLFATQEQLTAHEKQHKGVKKHKCKECGKCFNMGSSLKDHLRTHSGEKPFLCSICGKGFSQSTNLRQHTMRHNKMKPYKCTSCEKSFVSKGELDAHLRKHSGEHPFVCDTCGSGFTTSSSLVKHKRIHTGERPYACDFCPMRFTALGTLKNHRRTHTGERPYGCKYCHKSFAQKSDMVAHTRTHTGERPYVCRICGSTFHQSSTMKTHMKIHDKKPIICRNAPHTSVSTTEATKMGKTNKKKNVGVQNKKPTTRKELRKQKRQEKKRIKHVFFSQKKAKGVLNEKKSGKKTERTEKAVQQPIISDGSDEEIPSDDEVSLPGDNLKRPEKPVFESPMDRFIKAAEKKNKLVKEITGGSRKRRIAQLKAENEKEDRLIRQLEKKLKIDKKRGEKSVPKCFDDGFDYILELCLPENINKMYEAAKEAADLDEEANCSSSNGTKAGTSQKKENKREIRLKDAEKNICKRVFVRKRNLIQHMGSHSTKDKPFKCTDCPKLFATQEQLTAHEKQHKGVKKHKCKECGKCFNMGSSLKDHLRTHSGEKPFLCSICGKEATKMGKTNKKKNVGVQNKKPTTRKELRKQKRQEKKRIKHVFFSQKKAKGVLNEKKSGKKTERPEKAVQQPIISDGSDEEIPSDDEVSLPGDNLKRPEKPVLESPMDRFIKAAEKKNKLVKEITGGSRKRRIAQLKAENEKEDRLIRQLEKKLKIDKKRGEKSVPKCFDDGFDYILELCLPENINKMYEAAKEAADLDEEANCSSSNGTKAGTSQKKENKREIRLKDAEKKYFGNDSELESIDSELEEADEDALENGEGSEDDEDASDIDGGSEDDESASENGENSEEGEFSDENNEEASESESEDNDRSHRYVRAPKYDSDESNQEDFDEDFEENSEQSDVENVEEDDDEEDLSGKEENWEDIYGRKRDKEGNVVTDPVTNGKYIPPHLRAKKPTETSESPEKSEKIQRLRKQLKGWLNRLAEANLVKIAKDTEDLYMKNSRHDMNHTLCSLILESIVTPTAAAERMVLEHCLFIAVLHANVGNEVGAHFLEA
uniref:C2h2-type zn-finger protein n=1 Tax=Lutzomyia longipalpis TaxID=7200 RepID=A0A1B0CIX8_LUTLO